LFYYLCREAVGLPTQDKYEIAEEEENDDAMTSEILSALSTEMKRETTQIYPGSVFGLESYFSKHGNIQLDSILVRIIVVIFL
jgi:hypothetical protein